MKKVISFSLWGENPKYTIGAIRNADLATVFYPDWICRFYVAKNVPLHVIQELLARNNTEVFIVNEKPDWAGTFWRFFAACDPLVDVMISRDTDSRLGEREVLAVKEWENSDWGFHIMRDHPQHGTKILAGMWGIKKGLIQNMAELIRNYQKRDFHHADQNFLGKVIYPLINDNVLVHDPIFDKKPFPSQRVDYHFVGQVFDEHDQPVIGHLEDLKRFLFEERYCNTTGAAATKPLNIKAYKLYDHAAVVQPAAVERDGDAAPGATSASPAMRAASGTGWVLLCPHAFEATWNGGPSPEDIAIRLDAAQDDAPAFVQSNLGSGLLTFYSGYQLHTSGPDRLWVRGPINWPKDGLHALEQIVDTSLLPATITINWQCTRPNQTVRFEAGEPFCALVPYPNHYAEQFACEVVELDDDGAVLEQALQQLIQAPDLQAVFQRLQQAAAPAEPKLAAGAPQENMKVLIIQENGRHSKNRHFRECFALQSAFQHLGWKADIWGLGHPEFPSLAFSETGGGTLLSGSGQGGINKTLDFNAYDVIFNLENYDQIGWVPSLTHVKAYKIMWAIDAHVRGIAPYRELYLRDRYDMMLQSTRDFIVEEEDARIRENSVWFPNCFNDAFIYPRDIEKKYDVGFCGNIANREPYLSFIEASFHLKRDIFIIGADMVHAIHSYKIHFNRNIANDINSRNFETLGCKTLLLTNTNPQYGDLGFVDGENCLIYHDLAELRDKIQYALDHPQQREQIAENGYQLGKRHTYNERVKALVTLLQRKV